MVTSGSDGTITDHMLDSAFVGKLHAGPEILREASLLVAEEDKTPRQCLLFCEGHEHTLSIVDSKGKCHCGQTTHKYVKFYSSCSQGKNVA